MQKLQYENVVRTQDVPNFLESVSNQLAIKIRDMIKVTNSDNNAAIGQGQSQIRIDAVVVDKNYLKVLFGPIRRLIGDDVFTQIEAGINAGKSEEQIVAEAQQLIQSKSQSTGTPPDGQPALNSGQPKENTSSTPSDSGTFENDDLDDWSNKETLNTDNMDENQQSQPLAFEDKTLPKAEQTTSSDTGTGTVKSEQEKQDEMADQGEKSAQSEIDNAGTQEGTSVEDLLEKKQAEAPAGSNTETQTNEQPQAPVKTDEGSSQSADTDNTTGQEMAPVADANNTGVVGPDVQSNARVQSTQPGANEAPVKGAAKTGAAAAAAKTNATAPAKGNGRGSRK